MRNLFILLVLALAGFVYFRMTDPHYGCEVAEVNGRAVWDCHKNCTYVPGEKGRNGGGDGGGGWACGEGSVAIGGKGGSGSPPDATMDADVYRKMLKDQGHGGWGKSK